MGTDKITSISYSTDNGATWTTTENQNNKGENLSITVNVNEGDKILWKGIAETLGFYYNGNVLGSFFSSTAKFDAAGNIMSLLFGSDFKGQTGLTGKDCAFCKLFNSNSNLVNAQNLSLPATTLAEYCYSNMFQGCTGLTSAPELPATTLAESSYQYMFQGCTSLKTAPTLPAKTLASDCYQYMFDGCTSLITAPVLPAETLANWCYEGMFKGCSSLNYIKAMFTTTPSTTYTNNWVSGVASSGTFVKNSAATWNVTGVNGIPERWTIETATE